MPSRRSRIPCALTIAGSDSGGGAGLQADLKTFAALGVHGTSAVTCVTAQNPREVRGVQAIRPAVVRQQIEAVCEELPPAAVKTGMLYDAGILREVIAFFRSKGRPPLVVDPVMVATSGAQLLKPPALRLLRDQLLPLATLITPNLDEAALLVGQPLRDVEDLRSAARILRERHGCAVLLKGGHLPGREAVDVYWDGREELLLSAARIVGVSTHGTGCTYSAAVAGYLALECALAAAVGLAKEHITQSIAQSVRVGKHAVLEPWWVG